MLGLVLSNIINIINSDTFKDQWIQSINNAYDFDDEIFEPKSSGENVMLENDKNKNEVNVVNVVNVVNK